MAPSRGAAELARAEAGYWREFVTGPQTSVTGRVVMAVCLAALIIAGLVAARLLEQPDLSKFARSQAFFADALRNEAEIVDLVVDMRAAATLPAPDAVDRAGRRFAGAVSALRLQLVDSGAEQLGADRTRVLVGQIDGLERLGVDALGHIAAMRAAIQANDDAAAKREARATSEGLSAVVGRHQAIERSLTQAQHGAIGDGMQTLTNARLRDDALLGGLLLVALVLAAVGVRQTHRASQALKAAEAANNAKSGFLTVMSHEIRTPLNGVLGMAGALKTETLTPAQDEMVDTIVASGGLLLGLLNDLLDLSRIEAGRFELALTDFDLGQLVAEAASLYAGGAREKGLGFEVDLPKNLARAYRGDGARLRQVVGNLLGNAVKFTDHGRVGLKVARAGGEDDAPVLRFEIRDTGVGFDRSVKERLFRQFEQADASISRRFGGSGLGLSICQRMVRLMGGEIGCDSRPGEGSTFWFTLPLARASGAPAPEAAADKVDVTAMRILLADDNPTNRRVAAALLSPLEVELVMAEDGAQALSAYETGRFDLILMDMQMPVMDGLAAARAIRSLELQAGLPRIPILAMTANAMGHHIRACEEAGMDGHISKPLQTERLYAALAAAVQPSPAATEATRDVA
jgi:signal transduction histidine kinase/AmiR/NasT family two-component response regulator